MSTLTHPPVATVLDLLDRERTIAGPGYNTGSPWGYTTKGGTGVPVRTLLATIEGLIAG